MDTFICGSLAFDNIMVFNDYFKHHILPDKIHILNVSFLVPDLRRDFGGCAGNIAYNLKQLGGSPKIVATVGEDFAPYAMRLNQLELDQTHVLTVPNSYTAQAFITTDLDDNQITAFHPGAMMFSHHNSLSGIPSNSLGIIAPAGKRGMIQHAREFAEANVPFLFDPGQGLPLFSGDELIEMIDMATYVAMNDYEAQLVQEKTGKTVEELTKQVKAFIVTFGSQGSTIHTEDQTIAIPAVTPYQIIDPTGCGDAYRAGILYGIQQQWDWTKTGRLASILGSLKIASRGGQNHTYSHDDLNRIYQENFNGQLWD